MPGSSLLPDENPIRKVGRGAEPEQPAADILATEDPDVIREWAARRGAEPATGEATATGPATRCGAAPHATVPLRASW